MDAPARAPATARSCELPRPREGMSPMLLSTLEPSTGPGRASGTDELLFRSGDPDLMRSLVRGLRVIQAFSHAGRLPTISELSKLTGLNRAVVRRCLYTLRELGYVEGGGPGYRL